MEKSPPPHRDMIKLFCAAKVKKISIELQMKKTRSIKKWIAYFISKVGKRQLFNKISAERGCLIPMMITGDARKVAFLSLGGRINHRLIFSRAFVILFNLLVDRILLFRMITRYSCLMQRFSRKTVCYNQKAGIKLIWATYWYIRHFTDNLVRRNTS